MKTKMFPILERVLMLIVALCICEGVLKFVGYRPQENVNKVGIGGAYTKDEHTGWRQTEGIYKFYVGQNQAEQIVMTIWKDGKRATGPNEPDIQDGSEELIVFLGDSFTLGGNLQDAEAFPWLVQEAFDETIVLNFGTGGHGTCQSLLRLQELLKEDSYRSATFIYGFSWFHEARNVAHPHHAWMIARASLSRTAFMPYCTTDSNDALHFHPPEYFRLLPPVLENNSSLVNLLLEVYYSVKAIPRERMQRRVTEQIIARMDSLVRNSGGKFLVLLQRNDDSYKSHYESFLRKNGIAFIDGTHPEQFLPAMQIPNDRHPNEAMNQFWATKIIAYLRKERNKQEEPAAKERE